MSYRILPALAVVLTAAPGCSVEEDVDEDLVEESEFRLHNKVVCAAQGLGMRAAIYAATTGYGNWCGDNKVGTATTPPVNCWDNGCRTHDYAFHGPAIPFVALPPVAPHPLFRSCHEVFIDAICSNGGQCLQYLYYLVTEIFPHAPYSQALAPFVPDIPIPGTAPDTDCIDQADESLCAQFAECNAKVAAALDSWEWNKLTRKCKLPQKNMKPRRCEWLEHDYFGAPQVWTCGECPFSVENPPSLPPVPTAGGCARPIAETPAEQLDACCESISGDTRPSAPGATLCSCPADKPLRREETNSVECHACPPDQPIWNGQSWPCTEAYEGATPPAGAASCCEAEVDLEVAFWDPPEESWDHGSQHIGQFYVFNAGPGDAENVDIDLSSSSELELSAVTVTDPTVLGGVAPCSSSDHDATCSLGSLPQGATATVEFMATAASPGPGTIEGWVTTQSIELDLLDDSAMFERTVNCTGTFSIAGTIHVPEMGPVPGGYEFINAVDVQNASPGGPGYYGPWYPCVSGDVVVRPVLEYWNFQIAPTDANGHFSLGGLDAQEYRISPRCLTPDEAFHVTPADAYDPVTWYSDGSYSVTLDLCSNVLDLEFEGNYLISEWEWMEI